MVRTYYRRNTVLADRAKLSAERRGLARERRLEAFVDSDLVAGDELVGLVGHADDGLQFLEHFRGHAFRERGSRVRRDAVVAIVGHAYSDIDEFLGEGIEGARRHDLLDALPGALEQRGIVRDGLPEIVDPVRLSRGHDVVVNGANFGARILVFDQPKRGHVRSMEASAATVTGSAFARQLKARNRSIKPI